MSESRDLPVFWSGRPSPGSVTVPRAVAAVAGGRPAVPVWVNEAGGLTFEVGDGAERCFVKWAPAGSDELDLAAEADRMEWACRFHPVPRPLARGQDADGSWLVTAPVPGDSAVTARWKAEPALAVTAIGEGLRAMHDSLPAAGCPFSWSAAERLAAARRKAEAGGQDPAAWHPSHQGLTVAAALESAAAIPPADQLVVCHGDACAPNTLIGPAAAGPGTSTSAASASRTGGRTWRSRPGAPGGTTAPAGRGCCSTPTASSRIPNGPGTTACCGTLVSPGVSRVRSG